MRTRRVSVRGLLLAVALIAVVARLITAAIQVRNGPEHRWVRHEWERVDRPGGQTTACVVPFWPRYARLATGRPWPGSYRCDWCEDLEDLWVTEEGESRPHRLVATRSVTREEAWGIHWSLQSLSSFSSAIPAPVDEPGGDGQVHNARDE